MSERVVASPVGELRVVTVAAGDTVDRLAQRMVEKDHAADRFRVDPEALAARVTPRTRAIVPVHLFGLPCEMEAIEDRSAVALPAAQEQLNIDVLLDKKGMFF